MALIKNIMDHYAKTSIEGRYPTNPYDRPGWFKLLMQFFTDFAYTAPMFTDADYLSYRGHKVYLYRFNIEVPDVAKSKRMLKTIRDQVPEVDTNITEEDVTFHARHYPG